MLKLVDDWRKWYRLWSIKLNAIGAALLAAFIAYPSMMLEIWNSIMPAEVKELLPAQIGLAIPLALFIAAMVARVIKQEKLNGHQKNRPNRKG